MRTLSFIFAFVIFSFLFGYDASYYYEKAVSTYKRKDVKKTIEYLNKSLAKDSTYYKTYVFFGRINYSLKNYYKAISFFNKALEYEKNDYFIYYLLGITNDKFQNIKLTLGYFEKAVSLNSTHYPSLYNLALKYYDLDSLDLSKKYCYKTLAVKETAVVFSKIALIYYKQNIWDSTVVYLKKSLKLNKEDPLSYKILGDIYFQKEDYMNSIYYFQKAISLDNFYTEAYYQLGNVHLARKDANEALDNYFRVLPFINNEKIYYNIALAYYYLEKYDVSMNFLKRSNENLPKVKLLYAKIAYEKKNYKKSADYYSKLAQTDTLNNDKYYFELSHLYEKDSLLDLSLESINKALEIKPENLDYLYRIAKVYFLQKKYLEAIEVLENLKLKDEFNYNVYLLLGICCDEVQRESDAKEAFKLVYNLNKNNYVPYYYYGLYYYNQEKFELALKLFSNVLMIDPKNSKALYYYGRILYEIDKTTLSYIEKASSLGNEEATEFLLKIVSEKK